MKTGEMKPNSNKRSRFYNDFVDRLPWSTNYNATVILGPACFSTYRENPYDFILNFSKILMYFLKRQVLNLMFLVSLWLADIQRGVIWFAKSVTYLASIWKPFWAFFKMLLDYPYTILVDWTVDLYS